MPYRRLAFAAGSMLLATIAFASPQGGLGPDLLLGDPHELIPRPTGHATVIATADVEGDGDLDLFRAQVVYNTSSYVTKCANDLWINDGEGRFRETDQPFPMIPGLSTDALFVDTNGDGLPDIVTASDDSYSLSGQLRLIENVGGGAFTLSLTALPALGPCTTLAARDLDGDGDADLVAGRDGQDVVFENDGLGYFTEQPAYLPVDTTETLDLELADVDGDLDHDLVVARSSDLLLHTFAGSQWFTAGTTTLPGGSGWVKSGDVDGDGDIDLLSEGVLLRNNGGAFTTEPCALAGELWDVDGDGDLDILGPDDLGLNDGTGMFTNAGYRLPPHPGGALGWSAGDLGGDGDVDLVYQSIDADPYGSDASNHLVLNDGAGFFEEVTEKAVELPGAQISDAVFVDMDGDGDPDLVTGSTVDGYMGSWERKIGLFENDGNGRFTDLTEALMPVIPTRVHGVDVGDIDQDGDLDIVAAGYLNGDGNGSGTVLYRNDGPAGFTDVTSPQLNFQVPPGGAQVSFGDVDGDGDLDFLNTILSSYGYFRNEILLNDGFGNFSTSPGFNAPLEDATSGQLVDVDADGDLDVVTTGFAVQLHLNDGTGIFTDASANLVSSLGASLAAGDVDGDGDVDLFIGRYGPDELFFNDGTGVFASQPFPSVNADSENVELVDLDGDGDLDLIVAGPIAGSALYYVNDGTGTFTEDASRLPSGFLGRNTSCADVDRDGDLDVLLCSATSYTDARLYSNLLRHLAWHWLPRVGRTLRFDVTGSPSQPWALGISEGPGNYQTIAGRLLLDPLTLFLPGVGTLDASGTAFVDVPVPNLPALVGRTVYAQAVVDAPWRLTNCEVLELTGL